MEGEHWRSRRGVSRWRSLELLHPGGADLTGWKLEGRVMQCTFGAVGSIEIAEVPDSPWKFLSQGERVKLKRLEQKAPICLLEALSNKETISWIPFNIVKWKLSLYQNRGFFRRSIYPNAINERWVNLEILRSHVSGGQRWELENNNWPVLL